MQIVWSTFCRLREMSVIRSITIYLKSEWCRFENVLVPSFGLKNAKFTTIFFLGRLQSDFSHGSTFHICFSFSFRINVYLFFFLLKLNILWNGFQSAFHWYFPFRQINMHMQFSYKCKLNVSFSWDQQQQQQYRKKAEKSDTSELFVYIVCLYFQFNYKLKPNSTEPEKNKGWNCM